LREIFASARAHNQAELAGTELKAWISWARRSRLDAFKRALCALVRDGSLHELLPCQT